MKQVKFNEYGGPETLKIEEVEKPVINTDEVLIRIKAASVTSGDVRMRIGSKESLPMYPVSKLAIGWKKPRRPVLGFDFSGVIEEVGTDVTEYQVGDEVFGLTGKGTNQEYRSIKAIGTFTKKPENVSHVLSTSLPFGGTTALDFFKKADLKANDKVLIYGASGAVGTLAVQIAKVFQAEVTAVCGPKNVKLLEALGADYVFDYTKTDFRLLDKKYDIIMDTVGKVSFKSSKKNLKRDGKFIALVMTFGDGFRMMVNKFTNKKLIAGVAAGHVVDLEYLRDLVEEGKIQPIVEKTYPLDDVALAHEHVETGHKVGNIVLEI
jgi:NADPH:quinone reductase-like Zn-dependent oxidoreductase